MSYTIFRPNGGKIYFDALPCLVGHQFCIASVVGQVESLETILGGCQFIALGPILNSGGDWRFGLTSSNSLREEVIFP